MKSVVPMRDAGGCFTAPYQGLSGVIGNFHAPFQGGLGLVTAPGYPAWRGMPFSSFFLYLGPPPLIFTLALKRVVTVDHKDMKKIRISCENCKKETWHEIAKEHQQSCFDDDIRYDKIFEAQILRCCGCDCLSFRLLEHPFDCETNGKTVEYLYPERRLKRERKYFRSLPDSIKQIYHETVTAEDYGLYILTAVGIRAILEAIIADKKDKISLSKGSSLGSRIDQLEHLLGEQVLSTLHDFRFLGNKAVHSLKAPTSLELHRALVVIEYIMSFFYGLEESSNAFKELKRNDG